ncbi:MAG: MFS transporter [Legionellaceae bacterium]|nr:MFS transporter [Legionellaceae bacterium]
MHNVSDTKTSSTRYKTTYLPWLIWFLGAFFYFYENLIQVSPGVMVHDLMRDLSMDAGQLGILAGFFFYTYAPIQIPAGVLADHYNVRSLLVAAILFCTLGCAFFATSHSMWQASCGRLLIGLGSGFAAICSMKLATLLFPPRRFPFFVGLMVTLGMTGSIMGGGPLAIMVDNIGWRVTLYAFAVLGLILAVFVVWLVQTEQPNQEKTELEHEKTHILHGLKLVISCKKSWIVAGYGGLMFAPTSIFGGLWGVPFIMRAYMLDKPTAASLVSLLFLGWVIGGPLTGFLAGQFKTKRPIMLSGSFGALVSIILILYVPHLPLAMLGFFIFTFGLASSCLLPAFSLIKEIHDESNSGAALGFMNTANMLGGAIGLPLVGCLLNFTWHGNMEHGIKTYSTSNYMSALSLLPLMIFISFALLCFIKEKE